MEKRSVIIGMMSEICMKGKIILNSLKEGHAVDQDEILLRLGKMEKDMCDLSKEFESSMPR